MHAATLITAIICTHNPRHEYLNRVLKALEAQTLSTDRWNLVIVDNASSPPLESMLLHGMNLQAAVISEAKPGKVNAMTAAAPHVLSDWVVFVDDDNLLAPDYFAALSALSAEFPRIGVLSASIEGEFEAPVPDWA